MRLSRRERRTATAGGNKMKGLKLGIAALAIGTVMSSGAWAQNLGSQVQQKPQASLAQARWQYQDQDRDNDRDRDHDRRDKDRDRRDNGQWRNDRERSRNTGWDGRGDRDHDGDRDRDGNRVYRNGGYPVYGNNGQYGNGRGRYGYNNPAAQFGYQ